MIIMLKAKYFFWKAYDFIVDSLCEFIGAPIRQSRVEKYIIKETGSFSYFRNFPTELKKSEPMKDWVINGEIFGEIPKFPHEIQKECEKNKNFPNDDEIGFQAITEGFSNVTAIGNCSIECCKEYKDANFFGNLKQEDSNEKT